MQVNFNEDEFNRMKEENEALKRENASLRREVGWMRKVIANTSLSPAQKITIIAAAPKVVGKVSNREDGLIAVYMPELAEAVGMAPKTVGQNLKKLGDGGAINRVVSIESDGRLVNTHVAINFPLPLLQAPQRVQLTTPRNHGGKRQYCPHCGSENLEHRTILTCRDCSSVLKDERRDVQLEEETSLMFEEVECND